MPSLNGRTLDEQLNIADFRSLPGQPDEVQHLAATSSLDSLRSAGLRGMDSYTPKRQAHTGWTPFSVPPSALPKAPSVLGTSSSKLQVRPARIAKSTVGR